MRRSRDERIFIGFIIAMAALLAVFVVTALGMLLVSGWLTAFNAAGWKLVPNVHKTLWGWLTIWKHHQALYVKNGSHFEVVVPANDTRQVNGTPLLFAFLGALSLWVLYAVGELVAWGTSSFAGLAKKQAKGAK